MNELIALLNLEGATLYEFVIFGVVLNIISMIAVFVLTIFRTSTLDEKGIQSIVLFSKTRSFYIENYAPAWRKLASFIMMFMPTYVAWLNMIYLYYMLKTPGSWGIIKGTMEADKWEIIQLVRYENIKKKE